MELVEPRADKIVRECKASGEPYFVLRAKDLLSLLGLKAYQHAVDDYEGNDAEIAEGIAWTISCFQAWQRAHSDQVRFPD